MSQWVRLWEDMPDDPKWRVVAKRCGRPLHQVIAVFTRMLVNASKASVRGTLEGWDDEDEAIALDMEEDEVASIRNAMQGKVLDGLALSGWEKRQPKREDHSSDRVKAFRERQSELKRDETQRNAPEKRREDTDTELEPRDLREPETLPVPAMPEAGERPKLIEVPKSEKPKPEKPRNDYPIGFQQFWSGFPTDANMSKARAYSEWEKLTRPEKETAIASLSAFNNYCRSHNDYRPIHAERYLKDRRFEGHAESAAKLSTTKGVYVRVGTPAWRAWEAHYKQAGKGSPMTDKAGNGWYFPSELPPNGEEQAA